MSYAEKPPILTGNSRVDLNNLRDYLFRMAQSLGEVATAGLANPTSVSISYTKDGKQVLKPQTADQEIRQAAQALQALIIKSADEVRQYTDSKTEVYDQMYLARSEFGTFQETIEATIETTARGVEETYDYASAIEAELQQYVTTINGQIRRGVVWDPTPPGQYVTGIAISQNLQFTGECGPSDPGNPGDGYTYYYLNPGQTFGLYTSTGWQFWINGVRKGWYSSLDGLLHVAGILVEQSLQIGDKWQFISKPGSSDLRLQYIGT